MLKPWKRDNIFRERAIQERDRDRQRKKREVLRNYSSSYLQGPSGIKWSSKGFYGLELLVIFFIHQKIENGAIEKYGFNSKGIIIFLTYINFDIKNQNQKKKYFYIFRT